MPQNTGVLYCATRHGELQLAHRITPEQKHCSWVCDSFKSSGPDGVNMGFVKDFWPELCDDIMHFLSDFHMNGKLSKGINNTFISLIPKIECLQRLNDFRPISMVGSLYKILSKVLSNRLRRVMPSVISETQSAFIHGRQILDGIVIANEIVEDAKRLKKDLLLFKVDFEKAFDSIDWSYLEAVMKQINFPTLWRKWIMECVSTTSTYVLVNGSPTDEFKFERGLRQGDPFSPFLFLIAAGGLNVMMKVLVDVGLFSGYKVGAQNHISITHLQFVDDTLLIGERSWANIRALKALLLLFEATSGLKVNFQKIMLVGVNIHDSWLAEVASVLNCKLGRVSFLYMGLPIGGDPRKLKFWQSLIDLIKSRLSGWKSRNLTLGGRLVIIKSVFSSLPVYFLSFFKAPAGIISSIESIFNFFLGGCEEVRKISWINWDTICSKKEEGGLGVRRIREFNLPLLGKWCWRMRAENMSLWYRVLTARYGEVGGKIAEEGRFNSVWWNNLINVKNGVDVGGGSWFDDNVGREVGDGA